MSNIEEQNLTYTPSYDQKLMRETVRLLRAIAENTKPFDFEGTEIVGTIGATGTSDLEKRVTKAECEIKRVESIAANINAMTDRNIASWQTQLMRLVKCEDWIASVSGVTDPGRLRAVEERLVTSLVGQDGIRQEILSVQRSVNDVHNKSVSADNGLADRIGGLVAKIEHAHMRLDALVNLFEMKHYGETSDNEALMWLKARPNLLLSSVGAQSDEWMVYRSIHGVSSLESIGRGKTIASAVAQAQKYTS